MSDGTIISIAMAVYNGERFLQEQLDSFVAQTRIPDELVVSDDASTDRSVEIVRAFAARAPFPVKLLTNKRNVGCSGNFERAIEACSGDLIFLSDWDDVWRAEKLSKMEQVFRENPQVGVAISDWQTVDEALRPLDGPIYSVFLRKIERNPWCSRQALASGIAFNHWLPPAGCCSAFKSTLKPLILPFPDGKEFRRGYYDYFLLWAVVCSGAAGVQLIPQKLVYYRRHIAAHSSRAPSRRISDRFRSLRLGADTRKLFLLEAVMNRAQSSVANAFCVNPVLRSQVLKHWHSRRSLPARRVARIPTIAKELCSLRYHRFSSGFATAFADLIAVERSLGI